MGYHTAYSGEIEVSPTMTDEQQADFFRAIDIWSDTKERDVFADPPTPEGAALFDCLFTNHADLATVLHPHDGNTITVDGETSDTSDEVAEALETAIRLYFKPLGFKLDGCFYYNGDGTDDRGDIYINPETGEVEAVEDTTDNPGPSWKRKQQPEHVTKYLDAGGVVCPYCSSHDISGGAIDVEGRNAWQEISCNDCHREWTDEFTLTGITEQPEEKASA